MASAAIAQREIIRFEAGRPETVCLKYATGKEVNGRGGPQFMFTTVDDRIFFIDPDVAYNVEHCGVAAGEPITIVKHKGPRNTVNWDIRPGGGERPPAAASGRSPLPAAPPAACHSNSHDLSEQLEASIELAQARKAAAQQQPITPAQAKLLAALCVAIDSCVEAKAYAQHRGLPLEFTGEDVRCFANTILINGERGR